MSTTWTLTIALFGFWRAGTGRGYGVGVDAVVRRDEVGLPLLPGRHLRGLLRDALETLTILGDSSVPPGTAERLFGRPAGDGETRHDGTPGIVTVGSAHLPGAWRAYARALPAAQRTTEFAPLFPRLSSTTIDDHSGTAKSGGLRTAEVAVPMELHASIGGPLGKEDIDALRAAARWVRAVGGGRTRGLGRARLSLREGSSS